jgi:predicted O-linked N-acetylglucosamine transferase (SPINDLY family)
MAMTIRLTPEQQARFAARAEREGVSLSRLMILDCEAATDQAEKRRRLEEVSADVLDKSAELYRRLA